MGAEALTGERVEVLAEAGLLDETKAAVAQVGGLFGETITFEPLDNKPVGAKPNRAAPVAFGLEVQTGGRYGWHAVRGTKAGVRELIQQELCPGRRSGAGTAVGNGR